jgi:SAM-dependent methyltransferase
MSTIINSTAPLERLAHEVIIESTNKLMVADHFNRYRFCQQFVSGKKVLDAACGIGYGARLLAEAGAQHVHAIDISHEAITAARSYYAHPNIHFEVCDLLTFSANGAYDVIVSFETIEHIADTKRYLQVVQNCLKPAGLYFVSTPNRAVSNPQATRFDKPKNPFHQIEWTLDEFSDLLSGYFVVEEVYGQRSHYYKSTRVRTLESVFMSGRLRKLLHLSEADYRKLGQVRRIKPYHEPVFLVAKCVKKILGESA